MGADVVDLQSGAPGKFALDRKVPGLDVRIDGVLRLDHREERERRRRERPQGVETGEQLIAELGQSRNIPWVKIVADTVRIDVRRVVDFAPLRGVEEDSVAAAHHSLVGEPVGKAESWGERLFRAWVGHRAAKPQYGPAGRIPSRCDAV